MRYAGWREHEYAVDSRDDVPMNPDLDPSFAQIHAPAAPNRPSASPPEPTSVASPAPAAPNRPAVSPPEPTAFRYRTKEP